MRAQMMRVISSPSSSTTGFKTLILGMGDFHWRETREVLATRPYSIGALAGKAIALAALALCLNVQTASADAGPATDNALATLCGIVESSAKAEGLPVGFFTKLIWRESSFRPTAISPAGAQGVAQFMPRTASERGLADPFDPASAIPASARFLSRA